MGVVGCGAMAETFHLPALQSRGDCDLVALVDPDAARVTRFARRFGADHALTDHRDLARLGVSAAVVTAPNHLHAPITIDLLTAGIHVLVEKPMATSAGDCDAMLEAAAKSRRVLSVALMLRYSHAARFVKAVLDSGVLGRIESFRVDNGFKFAWPITSAFWLRREQAGGGVLLDLGSHVFDLLLWWLGDVAAVEYYDDSREGVEADCFAELTLESGVTGTVEFSRTRNLGRTAVVRGRSAELEMALLTNAVTMRLRGDVPWQLSGDAAPAVSQREPEQDSVHLLQAAHDDFFAAIATGQPLIVAPEDAKRSISLVEHCYQHRRPLDLPWMRSRVLDPA